MNRSLRLTLAGLAAGALVAGASIAGAVLAPPSTSVTLPPLPVDIGGGSDPAPVAPSNATTTAGTIELAGDAILAAAAQDVAAPSATLGNGQFLVGAARASLAPAPTTFGGTTWQTEGCTSWGVDGEQSVNQDHVMPSADDPRGWPAASPDCIYLGGFGLGPVRPAREVGPGGVWVRSIAISNGSRLFTYSIADTVGWFARYDADECEDCGILDVREALASDLKVDVGNVIVGSTHTHAGADTYGGWGGIPDWYRKQLREATIASVKQAVANVQLATIEVGEAPLREYNNQRRANYESTADTGATWLQAKGAAVTTCTGKGKSESCTTTAPVIATWSTFAGHPTIVDDPILHADWPGAAARRFESTFGGVGLMFEGGLGNVSVSGRGEGTKAARAEATGVAIADAITADMAKNAKPLATNTMRAAVSQFEHPAMTNPGLTTLGSVGLFDREFTPGTKGAGLPGVWTSNMPASPDAARTYRASTTDCTSAGPTVITVAGAHRIGEFVVAFGPGELFSNLTEVVKERVDWTAATMVLGQTNDALGYIIQSFEFDASANVLTHYGPDLVLGGVEELGVDDPPGPASSEYEEVFSIDRCLGDHVLEILLASGAAIR